MTGFGGFDHDHGLHALVAGPDGRWYFNAGNAGPHVVTDRSGRTLRAGSLYTGGTPYNLKNQGGMVSDDGRVWTGGLGLRMEPDGTRLTVVAHNFRNAYELPVDSFGDLWQNDNDDQVMTCRMTWLMEGANAGYFSADGTRYWQADRRPGQDTFTAHWHQDDPGVLPAGDNTGAGAPAGVARYEGRPARPALPRPAPQRRRRTECDLRVPSAAAWRWVHARAVRVRLEPGAPNENYIWNRSTRTGASGSGRATSPSARRRDLRRRLVRPDRRRPPDARRQRLRPHLPRHAKGPALRTPAIDLRTTAGQVQALLSPAVNVRSSGYERLRAQGAAALPAVKSVLGDPNPFIAPGRSGCSPSSVPTACAKSSSARRHRSADPSRCVSRAAKGESVGPRRGARLVGDPSPAVRREVALSLRGIPVRPEPRHPARARRGL